jgi:hypothetical protein
MGTNVMAIFCDEFLFYNAAVLPAILPTLATGALFVITSSIAPDSDSPVRQLLEAKFDNGHRIVKLLDWIEVFSMYICKQCLFSPRRLVLVARRRACRTNVPICSAPHSTSTASVATNVWMD